MQLKGKPQRKKDRGSQKQEHIEVNKEMTKTSTCHLSTVETRTHQLKRNDLYLEQFSRIVENQNKRQNEKKHVHEVYTDTINSERTHP